MVHRWRRYQSCWQDQGRLYGKSDIWMWYWKKRKDCIRMTWWRCNILAKINSKNNCMACWKFMLYLKSHESVWLKNWTNAWIWWEIRLGRTIRDRMSSILTHSNTRLMVKGTRYFFFQNILGYVCRQLLLNIQTSMMLKKTLGLFCVAVERNIQTSR